MASPRLPDEVVLRVEDGAEAMEARDIDDLAAPLRLMYPDESFDRSLRREWDREAEEREAAAIDQLLGLLEEAVLDELQREKAGSDEEPSRGGMRQVCDCGLYPHSGTEAGVRSQARQFCTAT